ncbi:MAG: hypothetical protein U5N10_09750 [Gemmobacter sp.]|nr:hypothetical protein [Gemmobacter sp.]
MPRPAPILLACLPLLAGCVAPDPKAVSALPLDATGQTRQLAELKDGMDAAAPPAAAAPQPEMAVPPLVGRGYAQIAGQPGTTRNEKRLMAIRAARMEAMRDLTEQVHGVRLDAQSTLKEAVVVDDRLAAHVSGVLYGARTRKVRPLQDDGYEVELELDRDTVGYILRMARRNG